MGHESQIEPWLAHDQRSACWFHKSLASSQIEYENHRGEPTSATPLPAAPRAFGAECENNPAQFQGGLKINKNSAEGQMFFVDFPSYRTLQEARSQERLVIGLSIVADNTSPKHWFLHLIGHQPRQNDRNKQQPTFHPIQVATKEQRLEPMAGCEFRPFDSN